jgi:hypothetical protein
VDCGKKVSHCSMRCKSCDAKHRHMDYPVNCPDCGERLVWECGRPHCVNENCSVIYLKKGVVHRDSVMTGEVLAQN